MISSGLKSTPCSLPPRKLTSCAAAPNLIWPKVRLTTFCACNAAGDNASATAMPASPRWPHSRHLVPRNGRRSNARIPVPEQGIAGARYKPRPQNQRADVDRRCAAAVLLQKSNSIGSTCRPDQQKRPVRDRQRDRKLTDDLTIGLDRQRAIPGDTRLSHAHDCDIAEERNAAEEQRGRITQH